MKKTGALLLSLLLMFIMGTRAAAASDTARYQSSDFEYVLLADGTAEIIGYSGTAGLLSVPNTLNGHAVTGIGEKAFYNNITLKGLILPEGITRIGKQAFHYCISLASISIPQSVRSIGDHAFQECGNLAGLTLPEGLESIGFAAFYNCGSLASLALPQSVTAIGSGAFFGCSSLTSLVIPERVTSIEDYAFQYCAGLAGLTIPEGVTSIGEFVFQGCGSLTALALPESLISIGRGAFYGCAGLTSLNIPLSVRSIGEDAFTDCPNLTLTVPRGSNASEFAKRNGIPTVYPDAPAGGEEPEEWLHVADLAGLFTPEEAEGLEKAMNQLYEDFAFDCLILTTNDSLGMSARDYSITFYEMFRVPPEDYPDAAVLSIHMDQNEYYELTKGLGFTALTSQGEDMLRSLLLPYLNAGTFGEGMFAYLEYVRSTLSAATGRE